MALRTLRMLRGGAAQGLGRLGWFVEQVEESIAVAVRERGRHLLGEADLVLCYDARLPDAELRVAHLLDDDCRVGECLRQGYPPFGVSRPALGLHKDRPSVLKVHPCGNVVKWDNPPVH